MSFYFELHIGPYAEWRVRRGKKSLSRYYEEVWYESLIEGKILTLITHDDLPEIKVGRVRYARYRFVPHQERPDAPPRRMAFPHGMADEEDWSWINPRAEMDWFSEAFAVELAVLATHFGEQPRMGWGLESNY